MNKIILAIALGFLTAVSVVCSANQTEDTIANSVIRLHIRANSNDIKDQQLKLKVRDRILKEAGQMFDNSKDIAIAREYTEENLNTITEIAKDEIRKNGYNYNVRTSFGKADFPTKIYGDMTLPAGTYEALVVEIGSGKGENWWCVMFPPLCFVEEAYAGIDEESEEILIQNLGEDTYSALKDGKVQIKFKVYEVLKNYGF
jgi:stage II sporulation protein R